MKKTNTVLLVVLCIALIAALALGACNSETGSSSSDLLPTTPEDSSSSVPAPTAQGSSQGAPNAGGDNSAGNGGMGTPAPDADAPSTPEGDGPHSFTGTIVDAGMGKFMIEVEGGYNLVVEYPDADLSGLSDSRPGATVTVTYTGKLDGADTAGIKVVSIANP